MMSTMEIQFYSSLVFLCFACLLSIDKWNLAVELSDLFGNGWQDVSSGGRALEKSVRVPALVRCSYRV